MEIKEGTNAAELVRQNMELKKPIEFYVQLDRKSKWVQCAHMERMMMLMKGMSTFACKIVQYAADGTKEFHYINPEYPL